MVKARPLLAHVGGDQVVETRLENRDLAAHQAPRSSRILVDADDVMAEIGETGAGDQTDIARPIMAIFISEISFPKSGGMRGGRGGPRAPSNMTERDLQPRSSANLGAINISAP